MNCETVALIAIKQYWFYVKTKITDYKIFKRETCFPKEYYVSVSSHRSVGKSGPGPTASSAEGLLLG